MIATSATREDHLDWYGLVGSRLRRLVGMLERNSLIELVHVNTEIFKLNKLEGEHGKEVPKSIWVVGLEFCNISSASIDLTKYLKDFIFAGTCKVRVSKYPSYIIYLMCIIFALQ